MDMKTNRWYVQVKMGDSKFIPSDEKLSARAALAAAINVIQEESGQFTRTNGDVMIHLSGRPFDEVSADWANHPVFQASIDESNPREGESREDYAQRLRDDDLPEATVTVMVLSWYGEADPESVAHLAVQQEWINDPTIQRLILLNANNDEYAKVSRDEYKRLKYYALDKYPTMCTDINWRTAD